MRTAILAALTAGFAATAMLPAANAQTTSYLGLDAMYWSYNESGFRSVESVGVRLRPGLRFSEGFGVEIHLASLGSESPGAREVALDYLAGGFLKGYVIAEERVNLYGLLGATHARVHSRGFDAELSDAWTGVSFGGGVEFLVAEQLYLGADYMYYLDHPDFTFSAISLGGRWEF